MYPLGNPDTGRACSALVSRSL